MQSCQTWGILSWHAVHVYVHEVRSRGGLVDGQKWLACTSYPQDLREAFFVAKSEDVHVEPNACMCAGSLRVRVRDYWSRLRHLLPACAISWRACLLQSTTHQGIYVSAVCSCPSVTDRASRLFVGIRPFYSPACASRGGIIQMLCPYARSLETLINPLIIQMIQCA